MSKISATGKRRAGTHPAAGDSLWFKVRQTHKGVVMNFILVVRMFSVISFLAKFQASRATS
jgi:hypothetical protein